MPTATHERRDGKARRTAAMTLGKARGWVALAGMVVAGGGGAQLGQQHAESAMTQDTAKMFMHTRDREVDAIRDDIRSLRTDMGHRLDTLEDRMLRK